MPISNDPDFRPGRDYLSNGEIKATGTLIGGAVGNICRELLERREADRWIPVSEKFPEKGMRVQVYFGGEKETYQDTWLFQNNNAYFSSHKSRAVAEHQKVTHWRPLPEPPKQGDKE